MTKQQCTTSSRRAATPTGENMNADTLSPPSLQEDAETQLNNAESGPEESEGTYQEVATQSGLTNKGKGVSNKSKLKGKSKMKYCIK